MNNRVFNIALLAGWLMIIIGLGLWSVAAALVAGGALLMGVTLMLALRAGVVKPNQTEG